MAIWLRLIISVLIAREPDEAFKYFENAQQLVANSPVRLEASALAMTLRE
jgi:hypothetical protein